MTPIERAAQAVINEMQGQGACVGGEPGNLRSVPVDGVIDAEAIVRAIVSVIREPSPAMIAAADEVAGTINPIDAYELAIDALLKEGA